MARSLVLAMVGLIACAVPALGGPPSPAQSQLDPCIVTCPAGDSVFVLITRHASGSPGDAGNETEVDLCGCPNVRLAPVAEDASYWLVGCTARTLTEGWGIARFPLAAGGVCSGASIRVYCESQLMAVRSSVASFDQDGDLVVSSADLALIAGKLGTNDPTADFNCDGTVTQADLDIANAHLGHYDASIVGVGDAGVLELAVRPAPNPSRGPTDFALRFPEAGRALLAIFDPAGRRIATPLDRDVEPGTLGLHWDGRDGSGLAVPSGLYFYRLTVASRRTGGTLMVAR